MIKTFTRYGEDKKLPFVYSRYDSSSYRFFEDLYKQQEGTNKNVSFSHVFAGSNDGLVGGGWRQATVNSFVSPWLVPGFKRKINKIYFYSTNTGRNFRLGIYDSISTQTLQIPLAMASLLIVVTLLCFYAIHKLGEIELKV